MLQVFSKIRDDSSISNEAKEFLAFLPSDLNKKRQLWGILTTCRGSIPGGSKRFYSDHLPIYSKLYYRLPQAEPKREGRSLGQYSNWTGVLHRKWLCLTQLLLKVTFQKKLSLTDYRLHTRNLPKAYQLRSGLKNLIVLWAYVLRTLTYFSRNGTRFRARHSTKVHGNLPTRLSPVRCRCGKNPTLHVGRCK